MKRPGRKRKQKPITLAGHVSIVEVENPHYQRSHPESATNPRTIRSQFDMRESYAGFLHARGLINEAQKKAADRIRNAYERMGGVGAQAIDYSREVVDGGQIAQTVTDAHLDAARYLRQAFNHLGPEGYHLVVSFCGEGRWPKEFSRSNQMPKPGVQFRSLLTALAELWNWKTRPVRSWRVA